MLLMTKELEEKLYQYPIGSQDELGEEAEVIVKYFNPCGAGTWLIPKAKSRKMVIGCYTVICISLNGMGLCYALRIGKCVITV